MCSCVCLTLHSHPSQTPPVHRSVQQETIPSPNMCHCERVEEHSHLTAERQKNIDRQADQLRERKMETKRETDRESNREAERDRQTETM